MLSWVNIDAVVVVCWGIASFLATSDLVALLALLELAEDVLEIVFSHLILGLTSTVYCGYGLAASNVLATDR